MDECTLLVSWMGKWGMKDKEAGIFAEAQYEYHAVECKCTCLV